MDGLTVFFVHPHLPDIYQTFSHTYFMMDHQDKVSRRPFEKKKKKIDRLQCALPLKRASKVVWKTGESTVSPNVCARTAGDCGGTLRTNTMAIVQYGKQHSSLQLYQVPFPKIAPMRNRRTSHKVSWLNSVSWLLLLVVVWLTLPSPNAISCDHIIILPAVCALKRYSIVPIWRTVRRRCQCHAVCTAGSVANKMAAAACQLSRFPRWRPPVNVRHLPNHQGYANGG